MFKSSELPQRPNILIILMGSLGDVARGLAVVNDLKSSIPKCHLTWLVEPACLDLVQLNSDIDEVLVFERNLGRYGLFKLQRELAKREFDISLDLQRHLKSGIISFLSNAKIRIGFHKDNSKEFNWLFNNFQISKKPKNYPKLDHYREFVKYLGLEVPEKINFGLDLISGVDLSKFELKEHYLVIILASRWQSKNWNSQGYSELVEKALELFNCQVVLLGGMEERIIASKISCCLTSDRLLDLTGRTSIQELAAILSGGKACVSPDSGPAHLCASLNSPVITLFGPTDPDRVAPYNNMHLVIQKKLPCVPCNLKKCPGLNNLCMRLIKSQEVIGALKTLLQ